MLSKQTAGRCLASCYGLCTLHCAFCCALCMVRRAPRTTAALGPPAMTRRVTRKKARRRTVAGRVYRRRTLDSVMTEFEFRTEMFDEMLEVLKVLKVLDSKEP